MKTAAPAAFYDQDIANPASLALRPLEASPWKPLYDTVLRTIPRGRPIVDLGCGTGRLARLLADYEYDNYVGHDFSEAAIAEARRYVPDQGFAFHVTDLTEWTPTGHTNHTVFVCLETLEHLDDDLELVRRIPSAYPFVFSVPSHDSAAHVRTFPHVADVFARYERLLDFHGWRALDFGDVGRRIHVCDTTRRADSWS